ncbi:MAG: leucine-rich repeat domain-containing protein [Acidobacteriota bacterium]
MRDRDRSELRCAYRAVATQTRLAAPLKLLRCSLPVLVSLLTAACHTGPQTFADVEAGRIHLDAGEIEALRSLLASAGLPARQLGVEGELASTSGNWVEIDEEGHVWALGLAAAPELDSLEALAGLPKLARVRISNASALDRLEGLAAATELSFLMVQGGGLWNLADLAGCQALRVLDLRGNAIESLDDLPDLPELRTLDLAGNRIEHVAGLAGHERLERLDLSDNQVQSVVGLQDLPRLEWLNLARNRLTSLDGLSDLPELRQLLVDDNQLTDASAVDALPALEIVNLNGNALQVFPSLVRRLPQHLWQVNPGNLVP